MFCSCVTNLAEGGIPDFPRIVVGVIQPAGDADHNGQPYGHVDNIELKLLHVSDAFCYLLKTHHNTIMRMKSSVIASFDSDDIKSSATHLLAHEQEEEDTCVSAATHLLAHEPSPVATKADTDSRSKRSNRPRPQRHMRAHRCPAKPLEKKEKKRNSQESLP